MKKLEKVKVVKDKKYFNSPVDDKGNPYWIPIVVKDKSFLIGFINAYMFISDIHGITIADLHVALSSDRFNDILQDGTRIKDLSKKELKKKIKAMFNIPTKQEHPDNDEDILSDCFLSFSCPNCGMFYSFKDDTEIPEDDANCVTCGNAIIVYTYHYDGFFDFDGKAEMVDDILDEIQNENDLNE